MMLEQWIAESFVWGSIIAWNVTAFLFFADSLRVYLRSSLELSHLAPNSNGRKVVARGRLHISKWFVAGSGLGLLTGIMGVYRLTFPDLNAPGPIFIGATTRVLIVIMFFCFWRAKRSNLRLYGQAETFYRSRMR